MVVEGSVVARSGSRDGSSPPLEGLDPPVAGPDGGRPGGRLAGWGSVPLGWPGGPTGGASERSSRMTVSSESSRAVTRSSADIVWCGRQDTTQQKRSELC